MQEYQSNGTNFLSDKREGTTPGMLSLLMTTIMIIAGFLCIALNMWLIGMPDWKFFQENLLATVGTSLLTIGFVSSIFEILVRKSQISVIEQVVQRSLERSSPLIKDVMLSAVAETMPPRYVNIKRSGIYDVYDCLQIDKLREKFDRIEGPIRILKIWIPDLHVLQDAICRAIQDRGCTVQILLLDPLTTDAVRKRALALSHYSARDIILEIRKNIKVFREIRNRLLENGSPEQANQLQVKLFNSFISVSLYGIGERFIAGFFLRGRLSAARTHIRVSGTTNYFFQQLDAHFIGEWEGADPFDWAGVEDWLRATSKLAEENAELGD